MDEHRMGGEGGARAIPARLRALGGALGGTLGGPLDRLAADSGVHGDHALNPGMPACANPVPAAVLVPIVEHADAPSVLLTRRSATLRDHAGQISFPGGRIERDDASPQAAALREAHEETGLDSGQVHIVGCLPRYTTITGFSIVPVVGVVRPPLTLRHDGVEVSEIFEVPLEFMLDHANLQRRHHIVDGRKRRYFAYDYGAHHIWGATAGILVSFLRALAGMGMTRGDAMREPITPRTTSMTPDG